MFGGAELGVVGRGFGDDLLMLKVSVLGDFREGRPSVELWSSDRLL